jgi:flagellar motor protein MotB
MSDHDTKDKAHGDGAAAHGDGGHKAHKKHHHHGAHAEHEHEEGWIVSFADNVLLMMGFFVILLAMNMGPKGTSDAAASSETADDRMMDVAIAVREAFHNPVDLGSTKPEDQALIKRMKERAARGDNKTPGNEGEEGTGQTVRPSEWQGQDQAILFAERSSKLTDEARLRVATIAQRVRGSRWMVEVRGHASRWETFRDEKKGRELSYQRAWAVGEELSRQGVSWGQVRLVASGDAAPVSARARTPEEGQTNQRVEILVLKELVPMDPYNTEPARGE